MTPIEKNVIVVDEQGNEYEATYPKRAKGLVKNGRARFVDENKICLACPPSKIMEENKMADTKIKVDETTGEVIEKKEIPSKYTLDYALEQMETVRKEASAFAFETRDKISEIKSGGPEDLGAQAAAKACETLIKEQGELYRKLTDFYMGMISELKNASVDPADAAAARGQFLDFVTDCIGACSADVALPDFEKIWNMINS